MGLKLEAPSPFWGGELGPHLTQAYLHAKFHLEPSDRLATVHQRCRQTDRQNRTEQRSDSIGRTVLETVPVQFFQYFIGCYLHSFIAFIVVCRLVRCFYGLDD